MWVALRGTDTPWMAAEELSLLRERSQNYGLPIGTEEEYKGGGGAWLHPGGDLSLGRAASPLILSFPPGKVQDTGSSGLNHRMESLKQERAEEPQTPSKTAAPQHLWR